MQKTSSALLCVLALVWSSTAFAQRVDQLSAQNEGSPFLQVPEKQVPQTVSFEEGIAAVVNDGVISIGDVRNRLSLALLSSGMPNLPEMKQRILPQVMRSLIEEQLIIQEAKKLGISVSDEEIQKGLERIAQDNQVPGGDMEAFIKAQNIPPATLRAQVKSALLWNKLVLREIRPRIDIGDEEVKMAVQNLKDNAGKQEYLVSEIFLTVDKPQEEEQVKTFAEKLIEQIRAGSVFGAVARQFSQGTGAGTGGDIGWIRSGELAPEVDKELSEIGIKEIAGPVRSSSGYHIIGLRDKRTVAFGDIKDVKAKLGQVFRPFSNQGGQEGVLDEAKLLRDSLEGCEGIEAKLASSYPAWSWQNLGEVELGKAPSWLVEKVATLGEGKASEPMATDSGVLVLFLCSREAPDNIDREAIRNALGTEKMERLSRGFLRDLRRDAFLDVRLKEIP